MVDGHVFVSFGTFAGGIAAYGVGAAPACTGDCDAGGSVTVDELIRAVRIALDIDPLGGCTSIDVNGNGEVAVNELIAAVNRSLEGCN